MLETKTVNTAQTASEHNSIVYKLFSIATTSTKKIQKICKSPKSLTSEI